MVQVGKSARFVNLVNDTLENIAYIRASLNAYHMIGPDAIDVHDIPKVAVDVLIGNLLSVNEDERPFSMTLAFLVEFQLKGSQVGIKIVVAENDKVISMVAKPVGDLPGRAVAVRV
jgi:hypothetical protein